MKTIIIIIISLVVVLGAGFLLFKNGNNSVSNQQANQPQAFNQVPDDSTLKANLAKAGLDALGAEGTVMHIHVHLDIMVNGQQIVIPANLAIGSSFISPIHTHDTTGVIHIESPVAKDFTLGEFFTEWGLTFNNNCIANFCSDDSHKLIVAVNGTALTTDPSQYVLKAHDEIEIWYGNKSDNPYLIPSYVFPAGL